MSLLFTPEKRGLPTGLFDSGSRFGLVLCGLVVPWLIVSYGWRVMSMILGFGLLVWLVPWVLIVPSRLVPQPEGLGTGRRFRLPTFNRELLGICLGFFSFDYFVYLLLTWLPDYLVQVRHLTIMRAGLLSTMPYLVFGTGQATGGWIGDWLVKRGWDETRARKGIITVSFLSGLLLIPAVLVESADVAVALIIVSCLVGLSGGNINTLLQGCAPADEVGGWTGTQNFAGNLAGVVAPLATGILISRTGSYMSGFILAALVLVAGLIPYWFIVGRVKQTVG